METKKTFQEHFEYDMNLMHLPMPYPSNWMESLNRGVAYVIALSGLVKLWDRPIDQIFKAAGMGGAIATGGTAALEGGLAVGAMLGSVYVGLTTACLIDAASETLGVTAGDLIVQTIDTVSANLNKPYHDVLNAAVKIYPAAVTLSRKVSHVVRVNTRPVPRLGGAARRGR